MNSNPLAGEAPCQSSGGAARSENEFLSGGGGGDVGLGDGAGERLPDGGEDRLRPDDARQRGEGAEQNRVGKRTADVGSAPVRSPAMARRCPGGVRLATAAQVAGLRCSCWC